MQRDNRSVSAGHHIAHAEPNIPSLAQFAGIDIQPVHPRVDVLQPGTVVPDHDVVLWQAVEELARMAVLFLVGAVQPYDDAVKVWNLREFIEDLWQGLALQL